MKAFDNERPAPIMIDLGIAERFIEALTGNKTTPVTFQTIDDSGAKQKKLARTLNGSLQTRAEELRKLNDQGAGVFVTVNATDGTGRQARNITALRALFVAPQSRV